MRTRIFRGALAIGLISVVVLVGLLVRPSPSSSTLPATFRHIKSDLVNNAGSIQTKIILGVTNHTKEMLFITFHSFDTKRGSNWVFHPQGQQPVEFVLNGKNSSPFSLNPESASAGTLSLTNLPSGEPWRARFFVQKPLKGIGDIMARIRFLAIAVRMRLSGGGPSITDSFNSNSTYFGAPVEVITEEMPAVSGP